MPRFFFEYSDVGDWRDQEDVDLPNAAAAEYEAKRALPRIVGDAAMSGGAAQHFEITVRDERGSPIYSAAMSFTGRRFLK